MTVAGAPHGDEPRGLAAVARRDTPRAAAPYRTDTIQHPAQRTLVSDYSVRSRPRARAARPPTRRAAPGAPPGRFVAGSREMSRVLRITRDDSSRTVAFRCSSRAGARVAARSHRRHRWPRDTWRRGADCARDIRGSIHAMAPCATALIRRSLPTSRQIPPVGGDSCLDPRVVRCADLAKAMMCAASAGNVARGMYWRAHCAAGAGWEGDARPARGRRARARGAGARG